MSRPTWTSPGVWPSASSLTCFRHGSRRRPSRRVVSTEGPKEFSYVGNEEVGGFHGREVPAAVELGPVHDVVLGLSDAPDGDVHRKDRDPGGDRGRFVWLSPAFGAFVIQAGGGPCRRGQPVDTDVGEEPVTVNGVLGEPGGRVGPFLELLDDPGELADGGVGKRVGERLGPGGLDAGISRPSRSASVA